MLRCVRVLLSSPFLLLLLLVVFPSYRCGGNNHEAAAAAVPPAVVAEQASSSSSSASSSSAATTSSTANSGPSEMMSLLGIQKSAWENFSWQRDLRRDLHQHPELSMYEHWTSDRLQQELKSLGITSYTAGLGLRELPLTKDPTAAVDRTRKDLADKTAGGTGIIVDIGTGEEPCVAIRAELDALPITEETGLEFRSINPGKMHACGHDSHMAMTMGVAKILKEREKQLKGTVRLVFQPSEEMYGGAQDMVLDGALTRAPAVESIWGLHVIPSHPSGFLGTAPGPIMAKAILFSIVINGFGGHAGMPFQTRDPVPTAALVITALHSFLPRRISSTIRELAGLISIASVKTSSEVYNVLPDSVEIRGTLRALNGEFGDRLFQSLKDIVHGIVEGNGQTCDIQVVSGYPEVNNDVELFNFANRTLEDAISMYGKQSEELFNVPVRNYTVIEPRMGAEDFAYYCKHAKCLFAFIGAGSDQAYPLHHRKMTIDEEVMPSGSSYLAYIAIQRLEFLSRRKEGTASVVDAAGKDVVDTAGRGVAVSSNARDGTTQTTQTTDEL